MIVSNCAEYWSSLWNRCMNLDVNVGVIIVPMDRYDCLALSAICVAVGLHLGGQQEVYAVTAAAVLLQWVKMLYYLQPFPETGKCKACLRVCDVMNIDDVHQAFC